jgi:hypothetical protein
MLARKMRDPAERIEMQASLAATGASSIRPNAIKAGRHEDHNRNCQSRVAFKAAEKAQAAGPAPAPPVLKRRSLRGSVRASSAATEPTHRSDG